MNPLIRDAKRMICLLIVSVLVYMMLPYLNTTIQGAYFVGVVIGILMCLTLGVLTTAVGNIGLIVRLVFCSEEKLAKFLKEIGYKAQGIDKEE